MKSPAPHQSLTIKAMQQAAKQEGHVFTHILFVRGSEKTKPTGFMNVWPLPKLPQAEEAPQIISW